MYKHINYRYVVDIANGIFAGFSVFTDTYNKANQINPDSFKYY